MLSVFNFHAFSKDLKPSAKSKSIKSDAQVVEYFLHIAGSHIPPFPLFQIAVLRACHYPG
jgi:hypothetical protein